MRRDSCDTIKVRSGMEDSHHGDLEDVGTDMSSHLLPVSNGLLLLILAVLGNYYQKTLICESQYLLTSNSAVRWLVLFVFVYFSVGFASKVPRSPKDLLLTSIGVFVIFAALTKCSAKVSAFVFLLLVVLFSLNQREQWLRGKPASPTRDGEVKECVNWEYIVLTSLILLTASGFLYRYAIKQDTADNILSYIMHQDNCLVGKRSKYADI